MLIAPGAGSDPFMTFYIPITLSALICGFGPALFTAISSTIVVWFFFLPPAFSFSFTRAGDIVALMLFFASGLLVVVAVAVRYRSPQPYPKWHTHYGTWG